MHQVRLRVGANRILVDEAGELGWGGNSGFQAVNLAVQFGASRLILVGFDLNVVGGLHWHGRHREGLNNPRPSHLRAWAERLDAQADRFAELGVEVLNASPTSALGAYPKVTFAEALQAEPVA